MHKVLARWTAAFICGLCLLLLTSPMFAGDRTAGEISAPATTPTEVAEPTPGTNLDQLQNGTTTVNPEWSNGNINTSNSCYEEANSVPYRYFMLNLSAGTHHYFTISMEWTKGGMHAFDYLTQYDLSEAGPIATAGGPCGSPTTPPADCATPAGSYAIPNPLNISNYSGTIPPDFFTYVNPSFVLDGPGNLKFYNATIDSIGKYYFGGTSSDRTLNVVIYYQAINAGSVGFFWGGHLAAGIPSAWGVGNGSASVSGAPYHMRALNFDGGGGGNQDRSVQNGSICLPPIATITCSFPDSACADSVYYCFAPTGASSYTWSITGGTILSGQGNDTITYQVTGSPGSNLVVSLNACNPSSSCTGSYCCSADTVTAPIRICNVCPVASCHADTSVFLCALGPVCIPGFSCTDADGNLTSCGVSLGTLNGNTVCFTPTGTGIYPITLIATDARGCADTCTTNVTVVVNQPPVANAGRDSTLAQCTPAQICIAAGCSDPDGNLSTCQLISAVGTFNGSQICFTPTSAGSYSFILKATDACGATDYDTSVVNVAVNQPPVANAGRDTTLFQCTLAQICIAAGCSDPDNNLSTCQLVSGIGSLNGGGICFMPTGAGTYTFVVKATDACGATDYDTSVATVTVNQPPVANAGRDTTLFQCTPAQICIAAGCTDPDNNLSTCQLVSGLGTLNGGGICFTPTGSGTYTFVVKATDACGATDYDTSVATVTVNQPPVANAGRDTTLFQCTPAQICIAAGCTDPDNNLSTCQLVSGLGTLNGGGICFTPTGSGTYTFVVKATDACGATDYDTSVATVTINQPPVANAGVDTTLAQCAAEEICVPAGCSDPDGNLSTCQLVSGLGTFNGSQICFTPPSTGVYQFVLKATDACGLTDYDTSVVTVTINQPPVANAGRDTTLFQCTPAEICIVAGCSDPDNNLSTCQLVSGIGSLNGGGICFTPTGAGTYTFVVKATDACGATDYDTSVATVTVNQPPVANAGRDTTLFQCTPAQICIAAGCTDPDNNLSTCQLVSGLGTLNGGGICFTPTGSGTYTFIVKATDACGATDYDTSVAIVTINQPPVANAGRDTTAFQCTPAQICIAAGCSDPDNNLSTCQLVSGSGTLNGGGICFTPTGSGTYTFVVKATDACGATDYDTSVAIVTINQPPVANAGRDTTLTQCTPSEICVVAGCSDPDGNLTNCELLPPIGIFSGSTICFVPPNPGSYTFVLKATDACNAIDYDTVVVTVGFNNPPVANAGRDTTLFQCTPAQICIAAGCSDPDNNLSTCQLVSGSGTLNGGGICFTPTGSGAYTFVVKATDACGATDYDTSVAIVTINQPPVANAGSNLNLTCQTAGQQICWPAGCSDPDGDLSTCEVVSGGGSYADNQICFTPAASGSYTIVLRATDACGATDYDTVVVTVRLNSPPTITVDPSDTTIFCLQSGANQICVPFTYSDPDNNISEILVGGSLPADLTYGSGNGLFCFTPPSSNGAYSFTLTIRDSCNLQVQASHYHGVGLVDCDTATCFSVKIEKTHNSWQGHYEWVSVTIQGAGGEFGGFDFLLAYDNTAISPIEVQPGLLLTGCQWEYFTYRFGTQGNCGGPCPSGLLRIVAIADVSNGPHTPICFGPANASPSELFQIKYLVTNDRNFECQYVPVTFYWIDCGDNAISSVTGDTLYLDKMIFSFEGAILWNELDDVLFPDYARPQGLGAPDACLIGDKYYPIRCIEFWEGGIDIACADSIDARGDLNLNGIANEIADAVMYTNYFLFGASALDPDPQRRAAQTAASDVNADGRPLTVGDLVYLIRIITGDALPYPKLTPFAQSAIVHFDGSSITTESDVDLGAMLLILKAAGDYTITNLTDMTIAQSEADGQVRVLLYDVSRKAIESGFQNVLSISGNLELLAVEIADYNGNLVAAKIDNSAQLRQFAIGQNYPNPFNPETVIEFTIPAATEVVLRVFNLAGQSVTTLVNGTLPPGYHQVRWDGKDAAGNDAASGVYFYKIETSNFSETRKMLLVK